MKAKRGEKRHWGREGGTERKDAKWKVGQGDRVGEKGRQEEGNEVCWERGGSGSLLSRHF